MKNTKQRLAPHPLQIDEAWANNLKRVSLKLPKHQVVAVAGPSGAGKSSLVHHVVARTAKRRFGRLRGVLSQLSPSYEPRVGAVKGLPACIEVRQEPLRGHVRSTIATYTGILDLIASLYQHYGVSRSNSGAIVENLDEATFGAWLVRHYNGCSVTVARVAPGADLSSVSQLPSADPIFYRDRNSNWNRSTRSAMKALLPARLWIASPTKRIVVSDKDSVKDVLRNPSEPWLWIIDDTLYIEAGFHRLAEDDPLPYAPVSRRLFSFNSQALGNGQCEQCNGLGLIRGVGESSLIRDAKMPILDGGLNLPKSGDQFTHLGVLDLILRGLFYQADLPLTVSWNRLTDNHRQIILNGSGDVPIPELRLGEKRPGKAKRPFPGLIQLIKKKSESTASASKTFDHLVAEHLCSACHGSRYNHSARACAYRDIGLGEIMTSLTIGQLHEMVQRWVAKSDRNERSLLARLDSFLSVYSDLNLGHLQLGRSTPTLSGGESQRIRLGLGLALQLSDCFYLLDEPSRALHARDAADLARTIKGLCAEDNTVLLVEHNPILLQRADHLVVLGPGGGREGGEVVYEGPPHRYRDSVDNTTKQVKPKPGGSSFGETIKISKLSINNVEQATFAVLAQRLTAVVGVSGAGKSSAILRGLVPAVQARLEGSLLPGNCSLVLPKCVSFVEVVAQKMLGQNRRSVVATSLEVYDVIREHYASLDAARALGLKASDFSFNSEGACSACEGTGVARDGFGEETDESCHVCRGQRLAEMPMLVRSNGQTIADLLQLPVAELAACGHPAFGPSALERIQLMVELGLGHLQLSRATPSLSTGERQRLGIARFMARIESQKGPGLLVLDEPTAGLSISDARRVFAKLAELAQSSGHTLVVIEHKLDLLEMTDWIIEFGPGGGPFGGQVVFQGNHAKLLKADTASSEALKARFKRAPQHLTLSSRNVKRPTFTDAVSLSRTAQVFESFVANQDVREDQQAFRPLLPTVSLDPARYPDDVRVAELLDLQAVLRSSFNPVLSKGAIGMDDLTDIEVRLKGRSFGFSPVALQRRLGLTTLTDFVEATKQLKKMGFAKLWHNGKYLELSRPAGKSRATLDVNDVWVVCESDFDVAIRQIALRWAQGVVRVMDGIDEGVVLTSHFLPIEQTEGRIGVGLNDPHVGDPRSPNGRCAFCVGSGRLPVYPFDLIIADPRRPITDDKCWNPAVLAAIRSLRRARIIPEANFFSSQNIANFLEPYKRMDERTAFLFEHGIPWRRFLKPSAKRTDRTQDYFAWRGLHDYVYMVLGKIEHKQQLKDQFKEIPCPECKGTGAGWESALLLRKGRSLLDVLSSTRLSTISQTLDVKSQVLDVALKLGLGRLRPCERFRDLAPDDQKRLLIATTYSAPLENVTLLVADDWGLGADLPRTYFTKLGMSLVSCSGSSEAR